MKEFRKNCGITLISLIITVIVLSILAGVTISILTDSNGIIRKVSEAKEKTEQSKNDEDEKLRQIEDLLNNYTSNRNENNNLIFFVTSDMHMDLTAGSTNEEKIQTTQIMGNLANEYKANFIVNLGDCIAGKDSKSNAINALNTLVTETRNSTNVPVFFARGNHDDNGWYSYEYGGTYQEDEIINDVEWNQIVNNGGNIVKDTNNPNSNYFFYDDEKSKIRVFILDTEDFPYYIDYKPIGKNGINSLNWDNGEYFIKDNDNYILISKEEYESYSTKPQLYLYSYRYSSYGSGHAIRNAQLNFVANNLYSMNDDWAALFLMHVPLDTSKNDAERFGTRDALIRNHDILLSIINAYKNGTKCVLNGDGGYITDDIFMDESGDFSYDVNVDYTAKGKGEVIAFISGHTHWNNTNNEIGFKTSLSYGYRYISIGACDFSSIIINRENSTISVVRYGDVITPINTTDQAEAAGVKQGSVESGSIESGAYVVKYDQFYPELKNLINTNWNTTTEYGPGQNMKVNMEDYTVTLVDTNTNSNYETFLMAIPVKPYTTYTIGSSSQQGSFVGTITGMTGSGGRSGDLTQTKNDKGNSVITTGPRQYALVIMCHKSYIEGLMVIEGESLPESYIPYQ